MTYDTYRYIFFGAAILCAVMLIETVKLFFALHIRKAIGDLTGSNAKREIQKIRQENEQTENANNQKRTGNRRKGKAAAENSDSPPDYSRNMNTGVVTAKIATQNLSPDHDTIPDSDNETEVLSDISLDETALLSQFEEQDEAAYNETVLLNQNNTGTVVFEIERDITFIHTDEVIW